MPATAVIALLLVASIILGTAAVMRRSRRLGMVAAVAFALFIAAATVLVLGIGQM
jgi:hypothetical protein